MNFTNPNLINEYQLIEGNLVPLVPYTPDFQCFNWCSIQQVVHSNNLELSAILLVVFAFIFLILYEISGEIKILRAYKENFVYWSKLLLLLFLGFYILIIRMRLIW